MFRSDKDVVFAEKARPKLPRLRGEDFVKLFHPKPKPVPGHAVPVSLSASSLRHFPVIGHPDSPTSEAFRNLQSQIYLNWLGKSNTGSAIAVVSPDREEGRSYVASNLAVLFAQSGLRVLLIDADMRHPKMHQLFGLPEDEGLCTVLETARYFDNLYTMVDLDHLSVLPVGGRPANPQHLLQKPTFSHLVEFASNTYDVVILDTPASALSDDAQLVARIARSALLVCKKGQTKMSRAAAVLGRLESIGVQTVGSVMTAE